MEGMHPLSLDQIERNSFGEQEMKKKGDYSENTGFPSPGMYRDSRGLTCEQGGPPDVRSRRVSPRPE